MKSFIRSQWYILSVLVALSGIASIKAQTQTPNHNTGELLVKKEKYSIFENADHFTEDKKSSCLGNRWYLVAVYDIAPNESIDMNLEKFFKEVVPALPSILGCKSGHLESEYNLDIYLKNFWFGLNSGESYPVEHKSAGEVEGKEIPFMSLLISLNKHSYTTGEWQLITNDRDSFFFEEYFTMTDSSYTVGYMRSAPSIKVSGTQPSNWNLLFARKALANKKYESAPTVKKANEETRAKESAAMEAKLQADNKIREAKLTALGFSLTSTSDEWDLKKIVVGDFDQIRSRKDSAEFNILFGAYLNKYAEECSISLPSNKVEMTTEKCAAERVTTNGFGTVTGKTCVEWTAVGSGLYADPEMYKVKLELKRIQNSQINVAGTVNNPMAAVGDAFSLYSSTVSARNAMSYLFETNACTSRGLKRFQENLRRFALGEPPLKDKLASENTKSSSSESTTKKTVKKVENSRPQQKKPVKKRQPK